MIDTPLLRKKIKESGLKIKFVASELELSEYGFVLKLDGKNEFKVSEIKRLVSLLHLSADEKDLIFFADMCAKNGTSK